MTGEVGEVFHLSTLSIAEIQERRWQADEVRNREHWRNYTDGETHVLVVKVSQRHFDHCKSHKNCPVTAPVPPRRGWAKQATFDSLQTHLSGPSSF